MPESDTTGSSGTNGLTLTQQRLQRFMESTKNYNNHGQQSANNLVRHRRLLRRAPLSPASSDTNNNNDNNRDITRAAIRRYIDKVNKKTSPTAEESNSGNDERRLDLSPDNPEKQQQQFAFERPNGDWRSERTLELLARARDRQSRPSPVRTSPVHQSAPVPTVPSVDVKPTKDPQYHEGTSDETDRPNREKAPSAAVIPTVSSVDVVSVREPPQSEIKSVIDEGHKESPQPVPIPTVPSVDVSQHVVVHDEKVESSQKKEQSATVTSAPPVNVANRKRVPYVINDQKDEQYQQALQIVQRRMQDLERRRSPKGVESPDKNNMDQVDAPTPSSQRTIVKATEEENINVEASNPEPFDEQLPKQLSAQCTEIKVDVGERYIFDEDSTADSVKPSEASVVIAQKERNSCQMKSPTSPEHLGNDCMSVPPLNGPEFSSATLSSIENEQKDEALENAKADFPSMLEDSLFISKAGSRNDVLASKSAERHAANHVEKPKENHQSEVPKEGAEVADVLQNNEAPHKVQENSTLNVHDDQGVGIGDSFEERLFVLTSETLSPKETFDEDEKRSIEVAEIFADEKKEDDNMASPASSRSSSSAIVHLIRELYPHFYGHSQPSGIELETLRQFIAFSRPFIDGKDPSAFEVSQILSYAKKSGVSLEVADQLLDICGTVDWEGVNGIAEHGQDQKSVTDDENSKILSFLENLVAYLDEEADIRAETSQLEVGSFVVDTGFAADGYGVEVDLNDGYVRNEDAPGPKEEPWWEVAARIDALPFGELGYEASTGAVFASDRAVLKDDSDLSSPIAAKSSLDDEIDQFWQKQNNLSKNSRQTLKKRSKPSYQARVDFSNRMVKFQRQSTTYLETQIERDRHLYKWAKQKNREARRNWLSRLQLLENNEHPPPLNAVETTSRRIENNFENHTRNKHLFAKRWREPYSDRVQNHEGYFYIDKYSLYDSSSVYPPRNDLDGCPWEKRSVKQRFLAEHSVDGRNWFGCLSLKKGNKVVKQPVCRPSSMEMPMRAGEWTEEWYRRPQIDLIHATLGHDYDEYLSQDDLDDVGSWEDTPECGKIRNIQLKPGSRLSRVTPDVTSSLGRSRWRKRYLRKPNGGFIY